jgi:hypothetical protein
MTRDGFFEDLTTMLRLLAQLGTPDILEGEVAERIAGMKAGGPGITPDELQRYANAIDDAHENNEKALKELVKVLLRVVAGLGAELESFKKAQG